MFEEFNHFFQEEYFDLIVNNEIVLEAYSKKEENRIKKFLKENNFKEDNSSLTKEEIRKGYRRGTIETSIPDENGKKKRVDFEITPHPTGNNFSHGTSLSNKELSRIQMNKKTLASKPRISNFTFKHEEGHYAVYLDKKTGKYVIDLYKIKRLIEKHPELFSALNDHDSDPEEVFADRYALKNMPDKYKKQIIRSKTDEAGNTIRSAQMSHIIEYYENETNKFIKRGPSSSQWYHEDQARDIEFKIKSIKNKMEVLKSKIDFHKDMIKTCESRISENTRTLDMVFNRELEFIKKGYINNKFIDSLGKDINEYDKYIFMINNKIASLKEAKEYYTQIKEQAYKIQNSAYAKRSNLEHDLIWKPWMTDEEKNKINKIINRIDNSQTVKKANDEHTEAINKIYSLDNQIKKLTDEWNKNMDEKHQLLRNQDRAKESQRFVAAINNQKNLIKKHIDEIDREIKSYKKAILKDAEKMNTLKRSADSLSEAYVKHSTYAKHSPDVSKMSRDDVNKYMNKNIRKIEDNRDSTLIRQILAANSDEELENVINKYTQESFVDDKDDTSGTSDFDNDERTEPDDCYCEAYDAITGKEIPIDTAYTMDEMIARTYTESELNRSNTIYTKSNSIQKISDFPFNKAYFGSPHKIPNEFKLDGPLFITPYPGIASIFAVRPQNVRKYGVPRGVIVNRDYDEWNVSLKDTLLQKPLSELHVHIIGDGVVVKPTVELVSGYIYTIDITPEIKDHIYQSSGMNKTLEFCIDKLPSVTFSDIKKIDVRMSVDSNSRKMSPDEVQKFYERLKNELGQEDKHVQEATLSSKQRNKLEDSDFALVYTDSNGKKIRKYPIHDEAHCRAAAHMFPRGVPLKYHGTVARKILRRAHSFGIDTSGWKNLNKIK